MFNLIFTTIWLFLPAAFSNIFAMVSRHFPKVALLERPIDFGKEYKGQRLLGDGKTFRGYLFGVLFSILIAVVQMFLFKNIESLDKFIDVDYTNFNPFLWGGLAGLGALLGDSVESFFKRRVGIKRGEPWFPFDQIDFAIGASLISFFYKQLEVKYYLALVLIFFVGHIIIKYTGYLLGIDDKPI